MMEWKFDTLKINLIPCYQQMTPPDKNVRKYARKSFFYFHVVVDSFRLYLYLSHVLIFSSLLRAWLLPLRFASCSTSEMSRERQTFPPVVTVESYAPSFFAVNRRRYNTLFNTF